MAMKPLRPCRHPGCPELTREGYCPRHKPKRAGRRVSAQWHGWYSLPVWTGDRHSCCGSRSAAPAPPSIRLEIPGTAPGPRWWTTSSPTGAAGPGSSTRPTTRACASAITTRKRPGNRPRNGGKRGADLGVRREKTPGRLGAGAWTGAPVGAPREAEGLSPSAPG